MIELRTEYITRKEREIAEWRARIVAFIRDHGGKPREAEVWLRWMDDARKRGHVFADGK